MTALTMTALLSFGTTPANATRTTPAIQHLSKPADWDVRPDPPHLSLFFDVVSIVETEELILSIVDGRLQAPRRSKRDFDLVAVRRSMAPPAVVASEWIPINGPFSDTEDRMDLRQAATLARTLLTAETVSIHSARHALDRIDEIEKRFLSAKKRLLPPSLAKFDRMVRDFESGELSLERLAAELNRHLDAVPPTLARYRVMKAMESRINPAAVRESLRMLLRSLLSSGTVQDAVALVTHSIAYGTERLDARSYFGFLDRMSGFNGESLPAYPAVEGFRSYRQLSEGIDMETLVKETDQAIDSTYDRLAATPFEKNLIQSSRHLVKLRGAIERRLAVQAKPDLARHKM